MKFRKRPVVIDAEQFVVWDMNKIPPFYNNTRSYISCNKRSYYYDTNT